MGNTYIIRLLYHGETPKNGLRGCHCMTYDGVYYGMMHKIFYSSELENADHRNFDMITSPEAFSSSTGYGI